MITESGLQLMEIISSDIWDRQNQATIRIISIAGRDLHVQAVDTPNTRLEMASLSRAAVIF